MKDTADVSVSHVCVFTGGHVSVLHCKMLRSSYDCIYTVCDKTMNLFHSGNSYTYFQTYIGG